MKVAIGSPSVVKGAGGRLLLDWASRVDAGPFSSLGSLDIVSSYGYEPLAVLAAAAAVTQRVRLMTNIMLGPVRNSLILAKQALSIDAISGGRLSLGLAVGSREDDYYGSPTPYRRRGRGFEEQLALIKRLWAGESTRQGGGPVGPPSAQPNGPELLVGGYSPPGSRSGGAIGRWIHSVGRLSGPGFGRLHQDGGVMERLGPRGDVPFPGDADLCARTEGARGRRGLCSQLLRRFRGNADGARHLSADA